MDENVKVCPYHKLRIVKGTQYFTDRPGKDGPRFAQRTYHTMAGTDSDPDMTYVYWLSGKNMCWAKKRDVEIVDETP